ncbi:hypothetical protein FA13DRAFT_1730358, partial [Coprinellus micaceus]
MPGPRRGMRHDILTVSCCNSELVVPVEDPINKASFGLQEMETSSTTGTLTGSRTVTIQETGSLREGPAGGERRSSTEDLFSHNQLGAAHDKFDSAPDGVGALQVPEDDSLCSRRGDGESIQEVRFLGGNAAKAHQRSMASEAAREFAEDAMKGYDV